MTTAGTTQDKTQDKRWDGVSRVALTEMPPPRPFMANPTAVGVAAFSLTTFTLGLDTIGKFSPMLSILVLPLAAFYGGLTQWIAGWFALRRGDLFIASFMTTYGAFWWTYVTLHLFVIPRVGTAADEINTINLIMWTVITIIFTIATLGTNWFVFFTFVEFSITFIVAFIASGTGSMPIKHASGYLLLILGAMGWYIAMAELVNELVKRPVFPLFPFKKPLIPPLNGGGDQAVQPEPSPPIRSRRQP